MSKEMAIILLGALMVITPHLGIPGSWKGIIFLVGGLAIAGIGFLLRGEALSRGTGRSEHQPFVENTSTAPAPERRPEPRIGSLN